MTASESQNRAIVPVSDSAGLPVVDPPYGHYCLRGMAAVLARWAQAQPDGWLGRRCALTLRQIVLHRRRSVIDGDLWGLKVRWHPLDNVTDRHAFFLPNCWDVAEREFQDRHLQPDGVYLDVGANSGLYSLWALRRLDHRGTLIAVEPNPTMFSRFCCNLGLNAPRARFRLYPCGVAARAGHFTLQLVEKNLGGASLADRPVAAGWVTVACWPLYDLVRDAGLERIDFLKIDIEGYEAHALNPFYERAPPSLWPRFINIESPRGIDWNGRGYSVVQRTKQNTLLRLDRA